MVITVKFLLLGFHRRSNRQLHFSEKAAFLKPDIAIYVSSSLAESIFDSDKFKLLNLISLNQVFHDPNNFLLVRNTFTPE